MKKRKTYLNVVETILSLLESGVDIETVKNALVRGGFRRGEVNKLIGVIGEREGNKLINLTNQYLSNMKENLNSVVNLFSKTKQLD